VRPRPDAVSPRPRPKENIEASYYEAEARDVA